PAAAPLWQAGPTRFTARQRRILELMQYAQCCPQPKSAILDQNCSFACCGFVTTRDDSLRNQRAVSEDKETSAPGRSEERGNEIRSDKSNDPTADRRRLCTMARNR